MSKTLSTILTIFKVVRIIAKVVFVLCLVGAGGCLLALMMLSLIGNAASEWLAEEGLTLALAYPACLTGLIACAGEAVFAFLSERYFANVLDKGTPFTHESARELFRLGVASIIISVGIAFASGVVIGIFMVFNNNLPDVDLDYSVSLSTGLFFMFMSLIFKHGAELQPNPTEYKPFDPSVFTGGFGAAQGSTPSNTQNSTAATDNTPESNSAGNPDNSSDATPKSTSDDHLDSSFFM